MTLSVCPRCSAAFRGVDGPCLACGEADLDSSSAEAPDHEPELHLPFSGEPDFAAWVKETPFPSSDLSARSLSERARRLWLPVWLVDAAASGTWRAEVGFDYQVQSSRESLSGGQWRSTQVTETRIRWEPRAGSLSREHDNAAAPALIHHAALWERLGGIDTSGAVPASGEGAVRLPDLDPEAAWPQAEQALRARLAEDCRVAAGADHVRELQVRADYADRHWTWLLLPVVATWYADDAGVRHVVLAHGRTGRLAGPRHASTKRGLAWAFAIGALAGLMLLVTLAIGLGGLVLPLLFAVAAVTGVLFLLLAVAALWSAIRPRHWNRKQVPLPG